MDRCSPYPDRHWALFTIPPQRQADTHLYAHTIAFGHIYPYPGSCADFNSPGRADAHSHRRADGHAQDPHSKSYPHANIYRNAGSDRNSHSDAYPGTYSYPYTNSHPNAGSDRNSPPHRCSNTNAR